MKKPLVATAILLALLAPPRLFAEEDWVQVPSDSRAEDSAHSSPGDNQAVADFLGRIRAVPIASSKPCQIIGVSAEEAAVWRDQGVTKERQLKDLQDELGRHAKEEQIPEEWLAPIRGVIDREIGYAYEHPSATAEEIKSHWNAVCEAQSAALLPRQNQR